jgi:transcriptional regulator with XRE-family HTH domain
MTTKPLPRFAREIRSRREALNLSQDELAKLADITRVAISKYELGKRRPKYDTMLRIANALRCELNDLDLYSTYYSTAQRMASARPPRELREPISYEDQLAVCARKPPWLRELCNSINDLNTVERAIVQGAAELVLKKTAQAANG